jgi:hypothetical protein
MEDELLNKINNNDSSIKNENRSPTAANLLGSEIVYESQSDRSMSQTVDVERLSGSNSPTNPSSSTLHRSPSVTQFAHQLDSPTNHVVSEKVQNLAAQIYSELQRVISRFNDDDEIVSGLMPLIVNVLESLDLQLIETQQLQVELELLKDDNDQLILAFEKEKQVKKKLEQQLFEYEFQSDEEKQKLHQKIASLENIVKMLELKSKNSNDNGKTLDLDLPQRLLNGSSSPALFSVSIGRRKVGN